MAYTNGLLVNTVQETVILLLDLGNRKSQWMYTCVSSRERLSSFFSFRKCWADNDKMKEDRIWASETIIEYQIEPWHF